MKHSIAIVASFLFITANAQNVGIGTTTPTKAGLVVNSKVGSVYAIFGDNTSGVSIEGNWPGIHFNGYFSGGRRTLAAGYASGIEMEPATGDITIYNSPTTTAAGAFASDVPRLKISASGNVGIGSFAPAEKLDVSGFVISGGLKIRTTNYIELGAGTANKELNAGKIGYNLFTPDAVDMVGASVGGALRKLRFWAEGGSRFEGPINVGNINSFSGNNTDNININANTTTVGFSKLGTNSLGVKTMTFVVPITKETNSVGGSWAVAHVENIPVSARNIVSHTAHAVEYTTTSAYLYPLVGNGESSESGRGGYFFGTYLEQNWVRARFADCDLCDKGAKFVLHIVYTDQDLLQ